MFCTNCGSSDSSLRIVSCDGEKTELCEECIKTLIKDGEDVKPFVKLSEEDGNVFYILGKCKQAIKRIWSEEEWTKFRDEATTGDYDHVLQTIMKYFDVE